MIRSGSLPEFTTVPMDQFPLKWRFTDPRYDVLPPAHLAQVKPLAPADARQISDMIRAAGIHRDMPFTEGYFRKVTSTAISDRMDPEEERRIRKWLYQRGLPFQRRVLLCYQPEWSIETTWKLFIKYWSAFYYPYSDDLTIIDGSFQWALLFYHEHTAFFGTNLEHRGAYRR